MELTMQAAVDVNYPDRPDKYTSMFSITIRPSERFVIIAAVNGLLATDKKLNKEMMTFVLTRNHATRFDPEVVTEFGVLIQKELSYIAYNYEEDGDGLLRAKGAGIKAWSTISLALSNLTVASFREGNADLIRKSVENARKSMKRDKKLISALLKGSSKG